MRKHARWLVSIVAVTLVSSACSSSSDSGGNGASGAASSAGSGASVSSGGSASGGASSAGTSSGAGSGGAIAYVPPSCDQECQDYLVSRALYDTVWFIWSQNLVGKPVGVQDFTSDCPFGGSAHVTGINDYSDSGVSSADLLFDLQDCENLDDVYSLAFTGEFSLEGSWNADTDFAAVTYSSPAVAAVGTVDYYDEPPIDDTCDTTFVHEGGGDAWTMVGRRCGRNFSSEQALDPATGTGGTNGSGGSSSGSAGGGNSCTCFCPDGSDCTNASDPNPCGVDADGIPEACGCPVGCP